MLYKGAAVAGGIGTVGGVTGVAVLANKDSAKFEQVKKQVETTTETDLKDFIDFLGISKEGQKGLFAALKEKTDSFKTGDKIDISKIVSSFKTVGESKLKNEDSKIEAAIKKIKAEIEDKTREDIKKLDLEDKLKDLKDLKEKLKEELKLEKSKQDEKNNLCEVVQKELFRRLAEKEFKLEFEEKTKGEGLPTLIKACLTKKK